MSEFLPTGENQLKPRQKTLAEVERDYFIEIYKEQGFHITNSAKILGIGRATFYRKLKLYNKQLGAKRWDNE